MLLACKIKLPSNFRHNDILNFHRRDPQMLAERVDHDVIYKGIIWNRHPACLTIRFESRHVHAALDVDDLHEECDTRDLECLTCGMLGLNQPIEVFENRFKDHAQFGRLIAINPGLRVPLAATPFEAVTWAITGQQISIAVAISIRRRLIQTVGIRHSGGLWCYPDAFHLANVPVVDMRNAGFSKMKANTLSVLSRQVMAGLLFNPTKGSLSHEEVRKRLIEISGIGTWTVDYTLLRGFGFLDGSLHGDAALRRNLKSLLASREPVSASEAKNWLQEFSPWRGMVAAHLWAMSAALDPLTTGG